MASQKKRKVLSTRAAARKAWLVELGYTLRAFNSRNGTGIPALDAEIADVMEEQDRLAVAAQKAKLRRAHSRTVRKAVRYA